MCYREGIVATISDVAARARVSTATVSRVLNGITVRQDLAEAVRQAVLELDYSPSRAARSLRLRQSKVLGLILPDIENPFFTSLARGVEDVAQGLGYSVVLCNSDGDETKEARYLDIARSEQMAGIIIAPASDKTSLDEVLQHGRSVVAVDRPVRAEVDHVMFDNGALGREGVAALLDRGYRRIACITGPQDTVTARERASGWADGLTDRGLRPEEELLMYADFRVEGGVSAMRRLLQLPAPPDAVLATNNLVGVGVLRALADKKPHIAEVGVAVIGDLPFLTSSVSELSLLPLSPRVMGAVSARMLLERINSRSVGVHRSVMLDGSGSILTDTIL